MLGLFGTTVLCGDAQKPLAIMPTALGWRVAYAETSDGARLDTPGATLRLRVEPLKHIGLKGSALRGAVVWHKGENHIRIDPETAILDAFARAEGMEVEALKAAVEAVK